jgi:hypothetical protein
MIEQTMGGGHDPCIHEKLTEVYVLFYVCRSIMRRLHDSVATSTTELNYGSRHSRQ